MKILAAIDQSPLAERVLERAVELAAGGGSELTVLTVAEQFHDADVITETVIHVEDRLRERARDFAEMAARRMEAEGIRPRVVVETGFSPEENILRFAEEEGADMIVMGHRGRTGLSRFLLGSVAAKVVAHAPCSVMVVR